MNAIQRADPTALAKGVVQGAARRKLLGCNISQNLPEFSPLKHAFYNIPLPRTLESKNTHLPLP
jgi:hypothetical protein